MNEDAIQNEDFVPTQNGIRNALLTGFQSHRTLPEQSFLYRLTALGGERWQKVSQPNWDRVRTCNQPIFYRGRIMRAADAGREMLCILGENKRPLFKSEIDL